MDPWAQGWTQGSTHTLSVRWINGVGAATCRLLSALRLHTSTLEANVGAVMEEREPSAPAVRRVPASLLEVGD